MIFDIETDGFDATKIHVMSWVEEGTGDKPQSTNDYDTMRDLIKNAKTVIGHNIVTFDLPVIEKLLGVVPSGTIIDTLPISWYINHHKVRHGLEDYGVSYGVPKPVVEDWNSLTYEEYAHRCEEDVKINTKLWDELERKLSRLYYGEYDKIVAYLTFKMQCLKDQEQYRWKLDVPKAQDLQQTLTQLKEEKTDALANAMPRRIITKKVRPPKVMHKKDGSLSANGERWMQTLSENYYPPSTNTEITIVIGEELANPGSNQQVKDWLWDLGWVPKTFKYVQGENFGEERKIPQIRDNGELCDSVKDLVKVEPAIELLDGLTVINHRLAIVEGFLKAVDDEGYLYAGAHGLTNTFRFRHKNPLVNLPGVDKPYGEDIRGCLLQSKGHLIGCDMVSLEDTTKRHYMQPLDPEYVAEMSQDGFDPHLDLAKFAGVVTQDQIDQYNTGKLDLKAIRKNYKAANYACVYGVKETTLSRQTGMAKKEAKKLIDAYWERNWAVKQVAEKQKVREIGGFKWILNPVSGFWHSLRAEKDRWSTINQSTGVYCFDTFVALAKQNGLRVIGQFHDEIIVDTDDVERDTEILDRCCELLNDKLKLNVPLGIDYSVGTNYAEVH